MGVATVVATLLIVLYTAGISPAKLKKVDLNPANVFRTANRQVHLTYARSAKFVNDLRVVYEIQTRLQPDAEPSPTITPAPAPQQNSSRLPRIRRKNRRPRRIPDTRRLAMARCWRP